MTEIEKRILDVTERAGFDVLDRAPLAARAAEHRPAPAALHPAVRDRLSARYPEGLYRHQVEAIDLALEGRDVCLATSTSSGKSLVFMSVAAHHLAADPGARVLAVYPARALIQDQVEKWSEVLAPLGESAAVVDGSVPVMSRAHRLEEARVILMTPDVVQAWLMRCLDDAPVARFLRDLRVLVLDEAHTYEGVFGTSTAYLLRRLDRVAGPHVQISATATLGDPEDFVLRLTGRRAEVFGADRDASAAPPKVVLRARPQAGRGGFDGLVSVISELAREGAGRFLAFGDSRKLVEKLVAALDRKARGDAEDDAPFETAAADRRVLPYRAGYEPEDRTAIQQALAEGRLVGVVSTSALELGLDIGEIDVVVLLDAPPSAKAFRQRLGRAGRRGRPGVCLLLDVRGQAGRLDGWLDREVEPSWLYLDNRYLQYANALCAAHELALVPGREEVFDTLPDGFRRFLENEVNPTAAVASDLYPLKQRAGGDAPQLAFPVRTGVEQSFRVLGLASSEPLGSLTQSQMLREAYPGAVHLYMGRPYRVVRVDHRRGEIHAKRERHYTTMPLSQSQVFPRTDGGLLHVQRSDGGFVLEAEMQVSERVLGFVEKRGHRRIEARYGASSAWRQKPLARFFETTGVCWVLPDVPNDEDAAALLLEVFAQRFGVQTRDLGVGRFTADHTPLGAEKVQGLCVYDAAHGSLRLTQLFAEHFAEVADAALERARDVGPAALLPTLAALAAAARDLEPDPVAPVGGVALPSAPGGQWLPVVLPGSAAMHLDGGAAREVKVLGVRYTPQGLLYQLEHDDPTVRWLVKPETVQPIYGVSKTGRYDPMTGDLEDDED